MTGPSTSHERHALLWLFIQWRIKDNNKETIKSLLDLPIHMCPVDSSHKWPAKWNALHAMTSPCTRPQTYWFESKYDQTVSAISVTGGSKFLGMRIFFERKYLSFATHVTASCCLMIILLFISKLLEQMKRVGYIGSHNWDYYHGTNL